MALFFVISSLTLYLAYIDGTRSFGNGLFGYIMLMYLGTSFYSWYTKIISKQTLISLIILISIYFISNHFFKDNSIYGNSLGYSVATVAAIICFTIALEYKKSLSKITTFFGNISYSFYLLHQVLGYFFISLFIELDTPLSQIITFVIITIIAYLVNKYIEMPSNNYGHKYVKFNK